MKTLGYLLLEALEDKKLYNAIYENLKNSYLKESDDYDIKHLLNIILSEAKEMVDFPISEEGYLEVEEINSDLENHPRLKIVLMKDDKPNYIIDYSLKNLLVYRFVNFSFDPLWLTDLLWALLYDDSKYLPLNEKRVDKIDVANEIDLDSIRTGNKEISDHVYDDDDIDEGSKYFHEPEENL